MEEKEKDQDVLKEAPQGRGFFKGVATLKKDKMPESSLKMRKKASTDLGILTAENIIKNALDGIQRIGEDPFDQPLQLKAIIHKMVLTEAWETYKRNLLSRAKFFEGCHLDESFVPSKKMPNYEKKHIKQLPNFQINIFTESINHRPPLRLEILPRKTVDSRHYKELLVSLNGLLTDLKVSSVEYTIDQYCNSPGAVQSLFFEEARYLYLPFKRNAEIYGENFANWGGDTRMNSVYRISDTKVYERGNDNKKHGEYWEKKDLNRVRLEYTAPRKSPS